MPDAGDWDTARLTVAPFDATTDATLVVTAPPITPGATPVSTPVTASTGDGGATWTAPVLYGVAGVWRHSWTVTGVGAGVQHKLVAVAPKPSIGGGPS